MAKNPGTTQQNSPHQKWKLIAKFLGGIAFILIGIIALTISPGLGVVLFLWGVIWIFQIIIELIKKFKQSKAFPVLKRITIKVLVVLLICAVIVTLFNFIAGLSATTIIIVLLILILLK